jgi:hypothetical protein
MSQRLSHHSLFSPADLVVKEGKRTFPRAFCWTKMGDEAGQNLNGIIARKDAERELGDGVFFWGIGSALGPRFWKFVAETRNPLVLFSPMKSRPKLIDSRPERVFAWRSYVDKSGSKHLLPKHAFVTSRGTTTLSKKSYHYALVCKRERCLLGDEWPLLRWNTLRNFEGQKLGFSQVTAVVEQADKSQVAGPSYEVMFSASLVPPYYVTLSDPVELPMSFIKKFDRFWETRGWEDLYKDSREPNRYFQKFSALEPKERPVRLEEDFL